ncbi:DUF3313 domain-containing protein [Psychrobium sp. 1_MG-2023]|uniref:DUF3313 domain-containing protein n=1 Tax=Psychrobium sp. 1_MG-2023 TaxID=3062624 RepID=UPI000C3423CB|nr:DUF3313 domain-containing protein [Psychrobium sp. 1_MG-2023]MDP2560667.1 DUF3313 domain-containing protein [Psychrobium sp. 1_MG-2023]PKF56563.1 DUF3313 domain-containing protein [Alteromonadales bacterium alter-6D02]
MRHSTLLTFIVISTFFLLGGCASTTNQAKSGFLKNYDGFVDSKEHDYAKVYRAPGFGRDTIAKVKDIKLVPFEMWLTPGPNTTFNPKQLAELSIYFDQVMREKLSANNYRLVKFARRDTLTIRGAFSGVRFDEPELAPTDLIPFRIVLNAGNAAYLKMTDKKDVITKVSVEMEFLKGIKKERIFAVMATKYVDATLANDGQDNLTAVKQLLDAWATSFVARLVEVREQP